MYAGLMRLLVKDYGEKPAPAVREKAGRTAQIPGLLTASPAPAAAHPRQACNRLHTCASLPR